MKTATQLLAQKDPVVWTVTADHSVLDAITLMATIACEVHQADARCSWTGFYRVVAPNLLKVGPYQGGHGCLAIPFDRGVCGAAARTGQAQLVPDVHAFAGHIACSSTTQSELVLPVFNKNKDLLAVFDLDSEQPAAFDADDVLFYQAVMDQIFAEVSL